MNNNKTPDKNFSLRDEMKRRKQAELEREIQRQKQEKLQGKVPTANSSALPKPVSAPGKPSTTTSSVRPIAPLPASIRTTVQAAIPDAVRVVSRPFQNLTRREKLVLTTVGAAVLIVFVLVGSVMLAGSSADESAAATPTLIAEPLFQVDNVLQRFQKVGVPISEIKPYDLANSQVWHAQAGIQFVAQRGKDRGSYTLLGFSTAKQATVDVFDALSQGKYQKWNIQNFSNIVLISPPETPADLQKEMLSHFTQYLFAPYRPFWPTSTPVPSPTMAATTAPTQGK